MDCKRLESMLMSRAHKLVQQRAVRLVEEDSENQSDSDMSKCQPGSSNRYAQEAAQHFRSALGLTNLLKPLTYRSISSLLCAFI